jgi:tungstate transport system substrate-binding protein
VSTFGVTGRRTAIGLLLGLSTCLPIPAVAAAEPVTVRCAVIGGMMDTGFWPAVAKRFEDATGQRVEVVASGPKHEIATAFRAGQMDLITMHASDTIINLVADGLAEDPQPWARNDLVLIGPRDDPAGVRGQADAVAALARIIDSHSPLLVHPSLGANEVLADLLEAGGLQLDPAHTIVLSSDKQRQMLRRAEKEGAYTLVGRIPFLNGKIARSALELMVEGDPRMRRPYVVAVASAKAANDPRHAAARQLAHFLRQPDTQSWIAQFGRGQLDDQPLFFPVVVTAADGAPR